MTDRRQSGEDNPFAPPPEGQPDRPWRPRHPAYNEPGEGRDQDEPGGREEGREDQPSRWGSQWSRQQPRRQGGGFGEPPPKPEGRNGERKGGGGLGNGRRWDPSDPAQRHARYAVLAGMWGVFSGLLGWEWLALLLGALALYWGISALRGGPSGQDGGGGRDEARRSQLVAQLEGGRDPGGRQEQAPDRTPGGPAGNGRSRPQFAAAMAGVVLASAALLIVATTYTVQLVYKDYFDCVDDALTTPSRQACEELLPSQVRPFLTEQD